MVNSSYQDDVSDESIQIPVKTCYVSFAVKILLSRHYSNKKLNLNWLENVKS